MKKIKIIVVMSLVFCFSGCILHKKDITQMVFPMTVLLSKQNNKFQIYLLVLSNSISSIIEMESSQHDTLYTTIMFEGDTISEETITTGLVSTYATHTNHWVGEGLVPISSIGNINKNATKIKIEKPKKEKK